MQREYSHSVNLDDDDANEIEVKIDPIVSRDDDDDDDDVKPVKRIERVALADDEDDETNDAAPVEEEENDARPTAQVVEDPRVSALEAELARVRSYLNDDQLVRSNRHDEEAEAAINSKIAAAKSKLKKTQEAGDTDGVIEATEELSNLTVDKRVLVMQREARKAAPVQEVRQPQQQPAQSAYPLAQTWKALNPWFESGDPKHAAATLLARGIDHEMGLKGWRPDKPGYYRELNRRIAAEVKSVKPVDITPAGSPPPRLAPAGGSGSRPAAPKGTVRLGPADYKIMRQTGLDPNDKKHQLAYARQKAAYGE